jgi:hypothetical protein
MKFLAILSLLFLSSFTFAKESNSDKKWKFSTGGFIVADYEAQLSVKGNDGIYAGVELPELLQMDPRTFSIFFEGHYKFNDKHRLEFGFKDIKSEGATNYTGTLFEGTILEKNFSGNISSLLNTTAFKLIYSYTLYKTDEIEALISAGFHRTSVELSIAADGVIDQDLSFDVSQPLPVIGTRIFYTISPKWKASFIYDVFAIGAGLELESNPGIKSFEGFLSDLTLSVEYSFVDYFSLGLGFNSVQYEFSLDNESNYTLEIENEVTGLVLFGSFYF